MPNWLKSLWGAMTGRGSAAAPADDAVALVACQPGGAVPVLTSLGAKPSFALLDPIDLPPLPAPAAAADLDHEPPARPRQTDFRLPERLAVTRVLNKPSSRTQQSEPVTKKSAPPRRHVWLAARPVRRSPAEVVALPRPVRIDRPLAEAA